MIHKRIIGAVTLFGAAAPIFIWVIGRNLLVKTAVVVEISTATMIISFLKEDTG